MLEYLDQYHRITNFNSILLDRFVENLKKLNLISYYFLNLKEKNLINKNLELHELSKNSKENINQIEEINKQKKILTEKEKK